MHISVTRNEKEKKTVSCDPYAEVFYDLGLKLYGLGFISFQRIMNLSEGILLEINGQY